MDEVMKKFCDERIKYYVDDFMSKQKDNLLIQLIGFLEDEKRQLEEKIGSGEVQKMDKYDIYEYREVQQDELPEPDENEEPMNLKIQVPETNGGLINLTDKSPDELAPPSPPQPNAGAGAPAGCSF